MRKTMLGIALTGTLLLGGCELKVGKSDKAATDPQDGASVSIGADGNVAITDEDGLAIRTPGFEGRINIKGMKLGGDNMEIDGMKLYPGTQLAAINIVDREGPDNGLVNMRFTSPATPDKVVAYYASAARDADYSGIAVTNAGRTATFTATKGDGEKVTITAAPTAKGSAGHIRVEHGR